MPNDAHEHMKMLLNVNKKATIVIESKLRANFCFLALMNDLRAIGHQFTQMNAYFLVMNRKRCKVRHNSLMYQALITKLDTK